MTWRAMSDRPYLADAADATINDGTVGPYVVRGGQIVRTHTKRKRRQREDSVNTILKAYHPAVVPVEPGRYCPPRHRHVR